MASKIFVVTADVGEYSDRRDYVVKAFKQRERAERYVVEADAAGREVFERIKSMLLTRGEGGETGLSVHRAISSLTYESDLEKMEASPYFAVIKELWLDKGYRIEDEYCKHGFPCDYTGPPIHTVQEVEVVDG